MSDFALEVHDLRVDYGDFVAVDGLSLKIPRGKVVGLVGPNGAGKTSTFKVLATLMEPTYGEVSMCGLDVLEETAKVRKLLGYMPDLAPVPSDLKLGEFLEFHADTHALGNKAQRRARVDECLARVNLTAKRNAWCRKLSRGQTQRLVLAKTLLHEPQVMILDEPASGLDPLSRRELRLTLQSLAREGVTVLVSSHILSELAEMCSSIIVMNQGKLLASGTAEEVRSELGSDRREMTMKILGTTGELFSWLTNREGVSELVQEEGAVKFDFVGDDEAQVQLLADCVRAGFAVKTLEEKRASFEEILVEVAEGNETPLEE
ncbi:ABC transporter ATP-binding protein [Roseibacillus persicicus]|uniref:ABC transporter ATP-binding protein n=1 Tax=Roseibacillus persicicus TaxID=454148 RepID=UPI00280F745D|nr:ABC transporter ATP-binding protein [Roseibacillus persicicus]MDQ8191298.1 ABC transporter ATP-binding protein [Roseibacillus persicicus]